MIGGALALGMGLYSIASSSLQLNSVAYSEWNRGNFRPEVSELEMSNLSKMAS
jgi:hypothetical protein